MKKIFVLCNFCFISAVAYQIHKNRSNHELNDKLRGESVTSLYSNSLTSMLELVNNSVDACADFFEHACGNYETYQRHKPPPFLINHEDRMHFFNEHKSEFVTPAGKNLQQLYDKCMNRGNNVRIQWRRLLKDVDFLKQHELIYKHFPILQHEWEYLVHDDVEGQINWLPLAAQFAAHGITTILQIYLAEQTVFIAPSTESIKTSEGGWRCPHWKNITSSLDVLLLYQNEQVAVIIGRELWQLCIELNNDLSNSNDSNIGQEDLFFNNDIIVFFEIFFKTLNLSSVDVAAARKLVINAPKLQHILRVVRKTQPRVLFNYVLWRAFHQLLYTDCFHLTVEFESALLAEYWSWKVFQPYFTRNPTLIRYLFYTSRYHKYQRKQIYAARSWESVLWRNHHSEQQRRKYLSNTRELESFIRSFANEQLNIENLTPIYDDIVLHNFNSHLVWMRRQKLRRSFFLPYIDDDDSHEPSYMLRQFLYFTISIIKRPLFHYFATIDFDLWHDTSQLIHKNDNFYTTWHCLTINYAQQLSEDEAFAIYQFGHAFRFIYDDYLFWLDTQTFDFAEDFFLSFYGMNRMRVLFYAVAQSYCGRNNELFKPRINRSFEQLLEFHIAFKCNNDSQMESINAVIKCM